MFSYEVMRDGICFIFLANGPFGKWFDSNSSSLLTIVIKDTKKIAKKSVILSTYSLMRMLTCLIQIPINPKKQSIAYYNAFILFPDR